MHSAWCLQGFWKLQHVKRDFARWEEHEFISWPTENHLPCVYLPLYFNSELERNKVTLLCYLLPFIHHIHDQHTGNSNWKMLEEANWSPPADLLAKAAAHETTQLFQEQFPTRARVGKQSNKQNWVHMVQHSLHPAASFIKPSLSSMVILDSCDQVSPFIREVWHGHKIISKQKSTYFQRQVSELKFHS